MWKECRLWIIDSLVSITLFLLVPILLSLTGLVTISVAPGAALIVLGYALYIFQCVFSRDMKRGIWALVDLMRNISVTHTFTVQEIQSCHSHFSVSRRVSEQTFAKYFIIRCINDAEHVIDLVTVKQQPLIEHNSYRIKYYPFSNIPSIGHAEYSANVHEQNGTLIVSGTLSDTYNFTEIREHDGKYTWLSVEANNLGYRLQKEGYGTEYAYAVPFEFEVP